jgi:hypothetical protein
MRMVRFSMLLSYEMKENIPKKSFEEHLKYLNKEFYKVKMDLYYMFNSEGELIFEIR